MTQSFREEIFSVGLVVCQRRSFIFGTPFSPFSKGWVYSISYCSKTRLRIPVSTVIGIFEFWNSSEYGGGQLCLRAILTRPLPARSAPLACRRRVGCRTAVWAV